MWQAVLGRKRRETSRNTLPGSHEVLGWPPLGSEPSVSTIILGGKMFLQHLDTSQVEVKAEVLQKTAAVLLQRARIQTQHISDWLSFTNK